MGAFFGALVFSARIGRRVVATHVLHYGYLLRRLALLRLCCLNAHALAGLRSCGTATNGALLALSRGGALTFNARHALACLGAGALTALAVDSAAGWARLLVAVLLHARHARLAEGSPRLRAGWHLVALQRAASADCPACWGAGPRPAACAGLRLRKRADPRPTRWTCCHWPCTPGLFGQAGSWQRANGQYDHCRHLHTQGMRTMRRVPDLLVCSARVRA